MKNAKMTICLMAVVLFVAVMNFSSADTIRGINMDFVTIGHAGNAGDTRTQIDSWGLPVASPYGCGSVGYNYRIGKYEVTNAQWNAFTSAAGAPTGNPSSAYGVPACFTGLQQPTNGQSWYGTLEFCNYLTSGDKSKGAYLFSGNNINPGTFLGINRAAAIATYGTVYVLPTQDEWYKAAYFKPDGSGYSLYANGTDIAPIAGVDSLYNGNGVALPPWNVGSGTMEQNGTFDMMGNLWEWNETLIGSSRGLRGGFDDDNTRSLEISSACQYQFNPASYAGSIGFRVESIPEPATLLLLGLGAAMAAKRW